MKIITGTHFSYYHVCHRKLWLFDRGILMEQTSGLVSEGKILHETAYSHRSERYKEIEIAGIKIDYYDHKNKVIHEIKKSSKENASHLWQVKYYIYILQRCGIEGVSAILEYPKEHKTEEVFLSGIDINLIGEMEEKIRSICEQDCCPSKIKASKCKRCSYYDFCYSSEQEEI